MKLIFRNFISFVIVFLIFSFFSVFAMLNPAMVYCNALGYKYEVINNTGYCIFPDGNKADAWKFLLGEEGKNYSYCARIGYEQKIVSDFKKCQKFLTDKCVVCILPNGTEIEVTELMKLNFEETKCGDGVCGIPENFKTCPQDCPSGSLDVYCDGVEDGICDPDCVRFNQREKDPDCIPVCGNKICETEKNETWRTCCMDCPCPKGKVCVNNTCVDTKTFCGNGICEDFENFASCPKDCPSGGKDNFCDGVEDNICDPDCEEQKGFDPDCVRKNNKIFILLIGGVIAFFVVLIIYAMLKRKEEEITAGFKEIYRTQFLRLF